MVFGAAVCKRSTTQTGACVGVESVILTNSCIFISLPREFCFMVDANTKIKAPKEAVTRKATRFLPKFADAVKVSITTMDDSDQFLKKKTVVFCLFFVVVFLKILGSLFFTGYMISQPSFLFFVSFFGSLESNTQRKNRAGWSDV